MVTQICLRVAERFQAYPWSVLTCPKGWWHIMADVLDRRRLSIDRIGHAVGVIDPVFLNSPQFRPESVERQLDCRVVVKIETLNPIRSFKGRGTEYLVSCLAGRPHLVCATDLRGDAEAAVTPLVIDGARRFGLSVSALRNASKHILGQF